MAKLSNLKPLVGTLSSSVTPMRDDHGHSAQAEPWRNWYSLAAWKVLRAEVFVRDNCTCQCGCATLITDRRELVADHVKAHRGDRRLFFDKANVQTLWKPHHDGWKQREERRAPTNHDVHRSPRPNGPMAHPSWFRRTHVPLFVVCGPPGAGKSTYVATHARPSDRVICFDAIRSRLFGDGSGKRVGDALEPAQVADVLKVRNEQLGDLMRASAREKWTGGWLIVGEPDPGGREWWSTQLGARVIVLATPAAECIRRISADADRGDVRNPQAVAAVADWWKRYQPSPVDQAAT